MGFPGGSEVKASAFNEGDLGSIPRLGRSPGEGKANPLQYSCLENPMDEEPGGVQSMVSQRVGHNRAIKNRSWSSQGLGQKVQELPILSIPWRPSESSLTSASLGSVILHVVQHGGSMVNQLSELAYPQFAIPGSLSSTPVTGPVHLFILSTWLDCVYPLSGWHG